jgi:hypothetical protein
MDRVIIGVDPHKQSVTIEAHDNREILRATGQFRTDARSYQRRGPVPRPQPLRVLDRHRAHRRLQWPASAPPAVAGREPPPQPRALQGRLRPAPQRHPRPRLLPAQARRRETPVEALRCLRRRLSDVVYPQLTADATSQQQQASRGGHPGASPTSSAASEERNARTQRAARRARNGTHGPSALRRMAPSPARRRPAILRRDAIRRNRPARYCAPGESASLRAVVWPQW